MKRSFFSLCLLAFILIAGTGCHENCLEYDPGEFDESYEETTGDFSETEATAEDISVTSDPQ